MRRVLRSPRLVAFALRIELSSSSRCVRDARRRFGNTTRRKNPCVRTQTTPVAMVWSGLVSGSRTGAYWFRFPGRLGLVSGSRTGAYVLVPSPRRLPPLRTYVPPVFSVASFPWLKSQQLLLSSARASCPAQLAGPDTCACKSHAETRAPAESGAFRAGGGR